MYIYLIYVYIFNTSTIYIYVQYIFNTCTSSIDFTFVLVVKCGKFLFCLVHSINDKGQELFWVHSCFNVMFVVLVPFRP